MKTSASRTHIRVCTSTPGCGRLPPIPSSICLLHLYSDICRSSRCTHEAVVVSVYRKSARTQTDNKYDTKWSLFYRICWRHLSWWPRVIIAMKAMVWILAVVCVTRSSLRSGVTFHPDRRTKLFHFSDHSQMMFAQVRNSLMWSKPQTHTRTHVYTHVYTHAYTYKDTYI